jgi:hypothetical protein
MFDYAELEVLGDLERLILVFDGINDEDFVHKLEIKRGHGRNDYPIRVIWNCILAMFVFSHESVEKLRRELSRNSQMRRIVGLDNCGRKRHLVPPAGVFSRFTKMIENEFSDLETLFKSLVGELTDLLPQFGRNMAGDGKFFDSYAKSEKKDGCDSTDARGEHDAKWAVKEYHYQDKDGNQKVKKEYHFGFKGHILCDVGTELPVMFTMTTANTDERKEMMDMLSAMPENLRERVSTISLDRGYDSTPMIKAVKDIGAIPIVDIRNCWKDGEETRQYKETDIVYDYKGNVFYVDVDSKMHKMLYEGYDKTKKCLRYSYKGKTYKIYISYDERVFLPIARDSKKFARIYKGRTAVERLNGRLDRDFIFEKHFIRGLAKMKTLFALSMIVMNAMAVAKVKAGQTEKLAALTQGLQKTA